MFALLRVMEGEALDRAQAFYAHCRDGDLAVAVAQTDVKGDRSLAPHKQDDPDMYLRVVEQGPDGIVVRGAKAHTSASPNSHELIVLPTRAMGPDDAEMGTVPKQDSSDSNSEEAESEMVDVTATG